MKKAIAWLAVLHLWFVVHAKRTRERGSDANEQLSNDVKRQFRHLGRTKRGRGKGKSSKSASSSDDVKPAPSPAPPPPTTTNCNFVFKYNDVKFFQVEDGGTILDFNQVPNDEDLITICTGNKCAGEPQEVIGVATGTCLDGMQDRFSFILATDNNPTFVDFRVFCPEVTWIGGGECVAIDINTEQPVLPFPNVTVTGPAMLVENIQFDSLVRCDLACIPRDIDM